MCSADPNRSTPKSITTVDLLVPANSFLTTLLGVEQCESEEPYLTRVFDDDSANRFSLMMPNRAIRDDWGGFYLAPSREPDSAKYIHREESKPDPYPDEPSAADGEDECVICMDRAVRTRAVPCDHRTMCVTCCRVYKDPACPVCRQVVGLYHRTCAIKQ